MFESQTKVSMGTVAAHSSERYLRRAREYIPERWISDEFASDDHSAMQSWSFGPRNCIGKR